MSKRHAIEARKAAKKNRALRKQMERMDPALRAQIENQQGRRANRYGRTRRSN